MQNVFTDPVMFLIALTFALAVTGVTVAILLHKYEGQWWWPALLILPAWGVTIYFFILSLDPTMPETRIPDPTLSSLVRSSIAWEKIVIAGYIIQAPLIAWLRRRRE